MDNFDLFAKSLDICKSIESMLDLKLLQVEQDTLLMEKLLYQELPKKKISKFQKISSMKSIPIKNEDNKLVKFEDTIKETLEKAQNTYENIKNEKNEKPISKNSNNLSQNSKIPKVPLANTAKNRKFSLNTRNKNENIKSSNEKPITKVEENTKNTPNKEEIKKSSEESTENKSNNEYFLFRKENLNEKFSQQKNILQVYYEIKKKIIANKKGYLENLNYYKEKNIKAQSKFLNKLENHYAEKKKVLKQKFLKKDPDINLTLYNDDKNFSKVNFEFYSLQNYIKLLNYYSDMNTSKEIKEILLLDQNPELLTKKKIQDVFFLWCFTNFFEDSMKEINTKIENFFQNIYRKELPKIRKFFSEAITFDIMPAKKFKEKKMNDYSDFVLNYSFSDKKEKFPFSLTFEKKNYESQLGKDKINNELLWKSNQQIFSIFLKKLMIKYFLPSLEEIEKLMKFPKMREILKEKLKIIRMIYITCLEKKRFPLFYPK